MGRKGLKLSRLSAWRFIGREDAKSVLEDEAEALFDWPKTAVPSEPTLYKDTELEDLEMGWEDKWWPDSAGKDTVKVLWLQVSYYTNFSIYLFF